MRRSRTVGVSSIFSAKCGFERRELPLQAPPSSFNAVIMSFDTHAEPWKSNLQIQFGTRRVPHHQAVGSFRRNLNEERGEPSDATRLHHRTFFPYTSGGESVAESPSWQEHYSTVKQKRDGGGGRGERRASTCSAGLQPDTDLAGSGGDDQSWPQPPISSWYHCSKSRLAE